MYTYQSAVLRKRGKNQVFTSVNAASILMPSLLADYVDGYIIMTNPSLSGNRYISLKKLKGAQLPITNQTLTLWLSAIGNAVLPELDEVPTLETKHISYANATQVGYRVMRVHPTQDPSAPAIDGSKTDLLLTRPGMDKDDFYNHTLVTVGGLIYRSDNTSHGIRIKDAGRNIEVSDASTSIGILSFKNVCAIQPHSVTEPMIEKNPLNAPLKQEVIIATSIDASNKGVMLVIGGYLHLNDSTFDIIEKNPLTIKVNTRRLALVQRFYESKKLKPMDHLNLSPLEDAPGVLSIAEFFSDENITAWLTQLNTFIVTTDSPVLYYKKHSINIPLIPGLFETHQVPYFPVRTTFGRLPETWVRATPGYTEDTKRYVMLGAPEDNTRPNYLFDTNTWETETIVDDMLTLPNAKPYGAAHLFEIGAQVNNFV